MMGTLMFVSACLRMEFAVRDWKLAELSTTGRIYCRLFSRRLAATNLAPEGGLCAMDLDALPVRAVLFSSDFSLAVVCLRVEVSLWAIGFLTLLAGVMSLEKLAAVLWILLRGRGFLAQRAHIRGFCFMWYGLLIRDCSSDLSKDVWLL